MSGPDWDEIEKQARRLVDGMSDEVVDETVRRQITAFDSLARQDSRQLAALIWDAAIVVEAQTGQRASTTLRAVADAAEERPVPEMIIAGVRQRNGFAP